MVSISKKRIEELFNGFQNKRIAVIGDLMIDRYFWGNVERISPEAPVPVIEVTEESNRLGGAANVANNIASLGGVPIIVGVVGNDEGAKVLKRLVEERGFPTCGIVEDASRPTTIKSRVIAHDHHIVRIDQEVKADICDATQKKILEALDDHFNDIDGIILEDYNKGVLTKQLVSDIIEQARRASKIVTVDPKYNNFFEYHNVTVFKPNKKEAEEALGKRLASMDDYKAAAEEILRKLNAENVLLTLGDMGMLLYEQSGASAHVATTARKVADVSGAGDTVISTLTMALLAGGTIREAAALANIAGGIVCGEVGVVPIDPKILFETAIDIFNGEQ
ncbi:MAG TPA: D-glycero-beta-D-manno-heptose-7-phosphate kinase [Bacteroidota bacterium]|nr:D-glycero-beta-D-manno-heptose-7-phosphate kinase [Bacteroidota bacterium]